MTFLPPLLLLLSLLTLLPALTSAATPTSFCKCTCFDNSTIIALGAGPASPAANGLLARAPSPSLDVRSRAEPPRTRRGEDDRKQNRADTCKDCNRQFCLGYNLPICKGAAEKDVTATCFQRDSRKDEAVVFIFIFATAGLLGWALIRPWVEGWAERVRERRSYLPVSTTVDEPPS